LAIGILNHFIDSSNFNIFEYEILNQNYNRLLYGQFGKIKTNFELEFKTTKGSKIINKGFQFEMDLVLENKNEIIIFEAKQDKKAKKFTFRNFWHDQGDFVKTYLLLAAGIFSMQAPDVSAMADASENVSQKKIYKTTVPKKMRDEKTSLIGKVLSHESAQVYPRRTGIVEDILVDIGDVVKKGQVLAYLLPEGVENQSGLEIQSKRNVMQKAWDDYGNTKAMSSAEIELLEKKFEQKKVALDRLKKNNYKNGNTQNLRLENEMFEVEYATLRLLETKYKENLVVCYFNHKLRPEADDEEKWIEKLGKEK